MKLQQSVVAMIAAGGLVLGLSTAQTGAATRYVWQESPSPGPPYTNWATAAHVIQQAVDAAQLGETVLVTNGVYAVGAVSVVENQTNRVALINPVILQSVNGPEVTVIPGAAAPDGSNGDGAIRCVYVGTDAILSGFTLTNGHAVIGGGVWCEASGVVTNCTVSGNSANDGGGAVGGALYNCALRGNSAQGVGGGAYASTLYNSTLNGNSADNSGGAFQSTLYSCSVTLNSAQGAGGGVGGNRPSDIYSSMYNCIVYHNTAPQGPNYFYSTFLFSCTSPLPQGEGNIEADPQLASMTHLSATSPCIGAGSATNISGVDIDGEPWADPPCIGADQFTSGYATGPIIVSLRSAYTNVAVGFAIPFTGSFEGRFAYSVWNFGDGTVKSNLPATSHAWGAPGTYTVTLRGFNESFPQGVSAQVQVTVVEQPVHYVNKANPTSAFPYASWQTAATNIQDAVDAATFPGSLVLVTNGVYTVGAVVTWDFPTIGVGVALTNPVVLRSVNGPEVTTVVSTLVSGEFILRCVDVGANATLSGFTITNGSAGGVWCESSGVVSNCVLTGNQAQHAGGAFGGTLYDCTLTGNFAWGYRDGAGYGGGAANAVLYNCVLAGNSVRGYGGGAVDSTLHHCVLTGNSVYGLWWGAGAGGGAYRGTLYNCVLTDNSAWEGGGTHGGTLNNCILTGNSARDRGGGAAGGALHNCTLTGNSAETGGGVYGEESDIGTAILDNCIVCIVPAILYNCIVYHNTAANGPNYLSGNGLTFLYSCTTPLPTNGVGNIDADPQLVSTTHLSANSPAIGAGSATYTRGMDIDGEPWANPPCMGADQLTPGNATGPLTLQIQADYTYVAAGFGVSFTALNTGRLLESVWDFGDGTWLTNRPYAGHAWSSAGTYTVRLVGYNDSFPGGISTSLVVTVSEGVYYVNQTGPSPLPPYASWETAATNIQDAVGAAFVGGVVLVTNGIYASGDLAWADAGRNRVVLNKIIRVQSVNGPNVTAIRGEAALDGGNGDGAIRCVYVGSNAVFSGFTLTNGHAVSGGGVWCVESGLVTNCVLTGNSADAGGGAIGGTLYNCLLKENSAGDGGGAVDARLNNCEIKDNAATGVGGGSVGGVLFNSILIGNSATHGGGAWGGEIRDSTLTRNLARENGGGVGRNPYIGAVTVSNCIVYFNQATDGANYFAFDPWSGSIDFNYSCTTPLPPGEGNIDADPRFMNAAAGDLHLRPDSPCVDAGTNLSAFLTTDFDGLPRPLDGNGDGIARFDMGAYEFNPYHFMPTLQITPDGFQFTVRGEPGKSVRIERSRDLVHWEFAGQVPIPASGQTLIDPAATTEPQMFYRVISIP